MVLNFHGNQIFMDFVRFLIHKVLCFRYNICSAWFLDISIILSTCFPAEYFFVFYAVCSIREY